MVDKILKICLICLIIVILVVLWDKYGAEISQHATNLTHKFLAFVRGD